MNHQIYVAKKDGTPKFLVVENEVYTLEPLTAVPELPPPAADEPSPRRPYRKAKRTPKKVARTSEPTARKCGKCGKPGHRRDNCPLDSDEPYGDRRFKGQRDVGREADDDEEEQEEERTLAAANNPPNAAQMDEAEIKAKINELRDQGLDSLRIAARLRIRLADVNKYWEPRPIVEEPR